MYLDDDSLNSAAARDWDVVVVGAGAVGLVLAVSLARAGKQVLLLESGSHDHSYAKDLNETRVTGRPHLGALHGRARVVGGTTTLWGGQLTRFVPYDFDDREIMGDCRWPIKYDDVAPYYTRVAALLGLDVAHVEDASVLDALGGRPAADDSGCEMFFTRWLREANLGRFFAADLAGLPSLIVATRCHATNIRCGDDASTIVGVEAVAGNGAVLTFSARELVLACGTIEISRLLLLVGRKSPQLPWAQNPAIGAYFQDHLDLVIGKIQVNDKKAFANTFENAVLEGFKYQPKVRMRTRVLRELGCLNIAGTLKFDSSIAEDLHLLKQFLKSLRTGTKVANPMQTLKRMLALGHVWFPLIWRYLRHRRILAMADRGISVIAHCEQRPMRQSTITLDASATDRFGDPIARLHWSVDEALQMKGLQVFAGQLRSFLRRECDADVTVRAEIVSGDLAVLAEAQDSYHQCGGARMAASSGEGVVDAQCQVFGTRNLHIAGAAVFPSSSFANPTYTAMALACRLSDRLSLRPA